MIERDGLARRFTSGLGLYSSERGIERRMAAAGYRLVETSSALASHSFQVFEPVDAPCTTPPATTP